MFSTHTQTNNGFTSTNEKQSACSHAVCSSAVGGNSRSGFTLMELLVVFSIIALLAAVVLSQVTSARVKAKNTGQIRQVQQYIRALEFARDANGGYPTVPGNNTFACLGVGYTASNCGANGTSQLESNATNINAALAAFIPAMPIGVASAGGYEGFIYREYPNDDTSANAGTGYRIRYALDGNSGCSAPNPCSYCQISGATAQNPTDTTHVTCEYTFP